MTNIISDYQWKQQGEDLRAAYVHVEEDGRYVRWRRQVTARELLGNTLR